MGGGVAWPGALVPLQMACDPPRARQRSPAMGPSQASIADSSRLIWLLLLVGGRGGGASRCRRSCSAASGCSAEVQPSDGCLRFFAGDDCTPRPGAPPRGAAAGSGASGATEGSGSGGGGKASAGCGAREAANCAHSRGAGRAPSGLEASLQAAAVSMLALVLDEAAACAGGKGARSTSRHRGHAGTFGWQEHREPVQQAACCCSGPHDDAVRS